MRAASAEKNDFDDFGRRAVRLSGCLALLLGVVVLLGWALDSATIKSVLPGLPPLKANAAISFVLLGIALLTQRTQKAVPLAVSTAAALCLLALTAATFAEHVFDFNLGIDELLFHDDMPGSSRLLRPGRMSPLAAVSFMLLVSAILPSPFRSPLNAWLQQLCILLPLLAASRGLVGLIYGVPLPYPILKAPMALHATIVFQIACIALLLSRREYYLARLFENSAAGSTLARRALAWTVGLPLALGLLCLQGERLGLYPQNYGVTMLVVLMALLLVALLVAGSGAMNRLDRERQVADATARVFQRASENDHLTGLLNRRGFLDRCEQALAQARCHDERLACIVLDIDFFKKINDHHGHGTGDDVLREFAVILQDECRQGDVVGRTGGEEFCVLLRAANEDTAKKVAECLRLAIAAQHFSVGDARLRVTCSGGVAELRPFHVGVHALIDCADAALLVAKQTGRNKIVTASSLEEGDVGEGCGGPLRKVLVRDIMVPVLASVGLDTAVARAAQQLMELNLDSLPVVDGSGKVIGFVTEQDVMTAMLATEGGEQPIASCNPRSVAIFDEKVAAEEIATFFSRSAVQRVVVIRQGAPVGLVSRRTLLRWLLNYSLDQQAIVPPVDSTSDVLVPAGLNESIRELAAAVSRLTRLEGADCDELLSSSVVSEATRIQESVENLLTSCRPRRTDLRPADQLTTGALSIA